MELGEMQAGTRVYFTDGYGNYSPGEWTGVYGSCGTLVILCECCSMPVWVDPNNLYIIPDFDPEMFVKEPETYRERLQREDDETQIAYIRQWNTDNPPGKYAVMSAPTIAVGLCSGIFGAFSYLDGHYGYALWGAALFVAAFWFASRLERGV